jgi:hypothetical protein
VTRLRTLLFLVGLVTGALGLVPLGPAAATYSAPSATPHGEKVAEGAARARVVVKLDRKSPAALHVPFKTVAGSAKPGKDYKTTKGTLTIKKGARSASIWIPLVDDDTPEPTEEFGVKLKDGGNYDLTSKKATVTIKDDDQSTVERWSGDLTVHVTQNNVTGTVTVADDWTMLLHLVLETDANHTTWTPTAASSWTLQGTRTSTDSASECAAHPSRWEIGTSGSFVPDPVGHNPSLGQSSWWVHGLYGKKSIDDSFLTPPVMEVGTTVVPATAYSYWDYTHTCSEHVASAEVTLGFQTQWRTSDPVAHPGTFPLRIGTSNGNETSLTVDFSDTYHQSAGMTTTSRVTGTLAAS